MGLFRKKNQQQPAPKHGASCSNCGCALTDPSWRRCPRCMQEISSCSGCGGCGGCHK